MTTNRRDFLRNTIIGTGILASGFAGQAETSVKPGTSKNIKNPEQLFNMSGYAAPKLDKVRVGFVGLGNRGPGAVERISCIDGVEITALCDVFEDRVETCQKMLEGKGLPSAKSYSGSNEAWKEMCQNPDIDLIYITTPWGTPLLSALSKGKPS